MSAPRLTWLRQQTWKILWHGFLVFPKPDASTYSQGSHHGWRAALQQCQWMRADVGMSTAWSFRTKFANWAELGGFLVVGNSKDQHQAGCHRRHHHHHNHHNHHHHHHHHDYDCYIMLYIYICIIRICINYIIYIFRNRQGTASSSCSIVNSTFWGGHISPGGHHRRQRAILDVGKPGEIFRCPRASHLIHTDMVNCWLYIPLYQYPHFIFIWYYIVDLIPTSSLYLTWWHDTWKQSRFPL